MTSPTPKDGADGLGAIVEAARAVLATADAAAKAALARRIGADGAAARPTVIAAPSAVGVPLLDRPARPARPLLLAPRAMAKRRAGKGPAARVALLHAIAHIELNAIDLAFDMLARFAAGVAAEGCPAADFAADWLAVGAEEALHFELLAQRLADFGAAYGDLPAHDGLWESAHKTADDVLARLAVVPLVLEARGLDVTPPMIERMTKFGDEATARLLARIHRDEIGHVATGRRWFERIARARGLEPGAAWRGLVRERFTGDLKPPFNTAARDEAGFPEAWYATGAA